MTAAELRRWALRNDAGEEFTTALPERIVVNDPLAMRHAPSCAARTGRDVPGAAGRDAVAGARRAGTRRARVARPCGRSVDLLPNPQLAARQDRVFIDYVDEAFRHDRLRYRLAACLAS